MIRTFRIADARLLEHTGVVLEALKTDFAQFSAFDPDLNEALVATLNTAFTTTLEEGGDDVARGKVGVKTQALLNAMKGCRGTVKQLRYWVKKTFENDPARQKRFRLTAFWNVANKQAELITFMSTLTATVKQFRPQLEAAKTPADVLDKVKTTTDVLIEANNVQENSKGARGTATQERIERLNMIHKIVQKFSDAAEYVYEANPAKRELYRIPGNSQPSTLDEEEVTE